MPLGTQMPQIITTRLLSELLSASSVKTPESPAFLSGVLQVLVWMRSFIPKNPENPAPSLVIPLKCHSVGGTSVPTGSTGACRQTDCASRREPATVGT